MRFPREREGEERGRKGGEREGRGREERERGGGGSVAGRYRR